MPLSGRNGATSIDFAVTTRGCRTALLDGWPRGERLTVSRTHAPWAAISIGSGLLPTQESVVELKVTRWQRYGLDRLYVNALDGTRVGWFDMHTGDSVVEVERLHDEFIDAVRRHRGHCDVVAHVATEPLRLPPPPPASPGSRVADDQPPLDVPVDQEPFAVRIDWSDLAVRRPGQAAREQALAQRRAAPVKTLVARILGVHTDERAWRIGAAGEQKVGAQLERLPKTWTTLHAVPVGTRGADIDHIVIGPGGVFTINAKHHPDASVWVGGNTFLVNGHRQPYVRNSRHEAQRALRLLSAAIGFRMPVTAVIAVVGAKGLTVKSQPDGVHVVARKRLARWLTHQPPALPPDHVTAIAQAARRSSTWH